MQVVLKNEIIVSIHLNRIFYGDSSNKLQAYLPI